MGVRVCERERETERGGGGERERERNRQTDFGCIPRWQETSRDVKWGVVGVVVVMLQEQLNQNLRHWLSILIIKIF